MAVTVSMLQSDPLTLDSLHYGLGAALATDSVLGPSYIGLDVGDTGRMVIFFGLGNRF